MRERQRRGRSDNQRFSAQTLLAKPEATNLFKDGGFEKPAVPSGSFLVFSTGQKFEKWHVVGANGSVGIVSTTFTQNGFDFPAKSGKQWVDLTGLSQTATGLSQTLATRANAKYKLVFWVGNVYDPTGIFGVSSTVNVLVDGQQIFTATIFAGVNYSGLAKVQHDDYGNVVEDKNRLD